MDVLQRIAMFRDVGILAALAWLAPVIGKAVIALAADRRRVRFTALHGKRIQVSGNVYKFLVRAIRALEFAGDRSPGRDELRRRGAAFADAANVFRACFDEHRFWMPSTMCSQVDALWDAIKAAGYALADSDPDVQAATRKQADELRAALRPLRSDLEESLRALVSEAGDSLARKQPRRMG